MRENQSHHVQEKPISPGAGIPACGFFPFFSYQRNANNKKGGGRQAGRQTRSKAWTDGRQFGTRRHGPRERMAHSGSQPSPQTNREPSLWKTEMPPRLGIPKSRQDGRRDPSRSRGKHGPFQKPWEEQQGRKIHVFEIRGRGSGRVTDLPARIIGKSTDLHAMRSAAGPRGVGALVIKSASFTVAGASGKLNCQALAHEVGSVFFEHLND